MSYKKPKKPKPTVWLTVGPPASGKSTWAEALMVSNPNIAYVSRDAILEERAKELGQTYDEVWDDPVAMTEIDSLHYTRLRDYLEAGRDIIIDRTNVSKKSRRKSLANVPKKYNVIAVVFEFRVCELLKRLDVRNSSGKTVDVATLMRFVNSFEPVDLDAEGINEVITIA